MVATVSRYIVEPKVRTATSSRRLCLQSLRVAQFAVTLLALAIVGGCSKKTEAQRPPPQVSVKSVTPATIPYEINFVAQTESSRQVDIVARVSGFLERIAYKEGDVVKEGDLLFQIDKKPFVAQVDAAKGALLAQRARYATASANLARVKPLAEMDALSQADLDRAQGENDASRAAVFTAEARLREAEIDLGYTTIRAPVTGVASKSQQREGVFLNAQGDTAKLTYVAAVDPMWVNFSVSQNQLASLRDEVAKGFVQQPKDKVVMVALEMSDGSVYPEKGQVNFLEPNFSSDTGSFMVRAVIPNARHDLRPGMFVTAKVEGYIRPNAVVVPQLAVQQGANGHLVYVIKADNTAEVRPVVVGNYYGEKDIIILDGLKAGDKVVVEGALKVVPGKPVQVVAAGAAEKAPSGESSKP